MIFKSQSFNEVLSKCWDWRGFYSWLQFQHGNCKNPSIPSKWSRKSRLRDEQGSKNWIVSVPFLKLLQISSNEAMSLSWDWDQSQFGVKQVSVLNEIAANSGWYLIHRIPNASLALNVNSFQFPANDPPLPAPGKNSHFIVFHSSACERILKNFSEYLWIFTDKKTFNILIFSA